MGNPAAPYNPYAPQQPGVFGAPPAAGYFKGKKSHHKKRRGSSSSSSSSTSSTETQPLVKEVLGERKEDTQPLLAPIDVSLSQPTDTNEKFGYDEIPENNKFIQNIVHASSDPCQASQVHERSVANISLPLNALSTNSSPIRVRHCVSNTTRHDNTNNHLSFFHLKAQQIDLTNSIEASRKCIKHSTLNDFSRMNLDSLPETAGENTCKAPLAVALTNAIYTTEDINNSNPPKLETLSLGAVDAMRFNRTSTTKQMMMGLSAIQVAEKSNMAAAGTGENRRHKSLDSARLLNEQLSKVLWGGGVAGHDLSSESEGSSDCEDDLNRGEKEATGNQMIDNERQDSPYDFKNFLSFFSKNGNFAETTVEQINNQNRISSSQKCEDVEQNELVEETATSDGELEDFNDLVAQGVSVSTGGGYGRLLFTDEDAEADEGASTSTILSVQETHIQMSVVEPDNGKSNIIKKESQCKSEKKTPAPLVVENKSKATHTNLAPEVQFLTHDGDLGSLGAFLLLLKQQLELINS
eukprot:GDKJ01003611.1.p1 GENE.GDKJ01003611.1~~GDKJ01003611.1.p1  ORF type:complete len:577 (+),score=146.40 GDKJ01003611.1:165-1733(+)